MPTYEYRCPRGHVFEKFFPSISEKRTEPCPTCGERAQRLISGGAGLVFKGSGFYITDYKRSGERRRGEGDGGGSADKSTGAEKEKKEKKEEKKKKDTSPGDK